MKRVRVPLSIRVFYPPQSLSADEHSLSLPPLSSSQQTLEHLPSQLHSPQASITAIMKLNSLISQAALVALPFNSLSTDKPCGNNIQCTNSCVGGVYQPITTDNGTVFGCNLIEYPTGPYVAARCSHNSRTAPTCKGTRCQYYLTESCVASAEDIKVYEKTCKAWPTAGIYKEVKTADYLVAYAAAMCKTCPGTNGQVPCQ